MGEAFPQKAGNEDGATFLVAVSPRAEEALKGRWGLCSQGKYESDKCQCCVSVSRGA